MDTKAMNCFLILKGHTRYLVYQTNIIYSPTQCHMNLFKLSFKPIQKARVTRNSAHSQETLKAIYQTSVLRQARLITSSLGTKSIN